MISTFGLLAQSRKFWVGTLTILAVIAATVGMATGKIPPAGFVPFIASVTAIGLASIGSIAWEDGKQKGSASISNVAGDLLTTTVTQAAPAAADAKDGAS